MRAAVNVVIAHFTLAIAAAAATAAAEERELQHDERRWLPSLAITSGVTFQRWSGIQHSALFDDDSATPGAPARLRPDGGDDDLGVTPFVGGAIELMTPALPIVSSPRFFASGEILPNFGSERQLVSEGVPSRVRGPDVGAVLAGEEDNMHFTTGPPAQVGPRSLGNGFSEVTANGQGSRLNVQAEPLMFGAKAGVAFPFEWRGRAVRIKPSVGWIRYAIEAKGVIVDATCKPVGTVTTLCTDTYTGPGGTVIQDGAFRESILTSQDTGVFDGVGPGIDLEMDVGRFGPIGAAVFLGIHAYYIPGDRDITFNASRTFNDADDLQPGTGTGSDTHVVSWNTRVAPWFYRGGVGIRFQWLGHPD